MHLDHGARLALLREVRHDLADVLARLHQLVRLEQALGAREAVADQALERLAPLLRGHLVQQLREAQRRVLAEQAELHGDVVDRLGEHVHRHGGARQVVTLRDVHKAAQVGQHVDTRLERRALERVEHHVEAVAPALGEPVAPALRPGADGARVGHVLVRHAQVVVQVVALLLAAHRAEHLHAVPLRDLDGTETHTTGGRVDQDRLARLDLRELHETVPDGAVGDRERRRLQLRHVARHLGQRVLRGKRHGALTHTARGAHHTVAGAHAAHRGAHILHVAGPLREPVRGGQQAGGREDVLEVERHRVGAHHHIVRAERREPVGVRVERLHAGRLALDQLQHPVAVLALQRREARLLHEAAAVRVAVLDQVEVLHAVAVHHVEEGGQHTLTLLERVARVERHQQRGQRRDLVRDGAGQTDRTRAHVRVVRDDPELADRARAELLLDLLHEQMLRVRLVVVHERVLALGAQQLLGHRAGGHHGHVRPGVRRALAEVDVERGALDAARREAQRAGVGRRGVVEQLAQLRHVVPHLDVHRLAAGHQQRVERGDRILRVARLAQQVGGHHQVERRGGRALEVIRGGTHVVRAREELRRATQVRGHVEPHHVHVHVALLRPGDQRLQVHLAVPRVRLEHAEHLARLALERGAEHVLRHVDHALERLAGELGVVKQRLLQLVLRHVHRVPAGKCLLERLCKLRVEPGEPLHKRIRLLGHQREELVRLRRGLEEARLPHLGERVARTRRVLNTRALETLEVGKGLARGTVEHEHVVLDQHIVADDRLHVEHQLLGVADLLRRAAHREDVEQVGQVRIHTQLAVVERQTRNPGAQERRVEQTGVEHHALRLAVRPEVRQHVHQRDVVVLARARRTHLVDHPERTRVLRAVGAQPAVERLTVHDNVKVAHPVLTEHLADVRGTHRRGLRAHLAGRVQRVEHHTRVVHRVLTRGTELPAAVDARLAERGVLGRTVLVHHKRAVDGHVGDGAGARLERRLGVAGTREHDGAADHVALGPAVRLRVDPEHGAAQRRLHRAAPNPLGVVHLVRLLLQRQEGVLGQLLAQRRVDTHRQVVPGVVVQLVHHNVSQTRLHHRADRGEELVHLAGHLGGLALLGVRTPRAAHNRGALRLHRAADLLHVGAKHRVRRHLDDHQAAVLLAPQLVQRLDRLAEQHRAAHVVPAVLCVERAARLEEPALDSGDEAPGGHVHRAVHQRVHLREEALLAGRHHRRVVRATHLEHTRKDVGLLAGLHHGVHQLVAARDGHGVGRVGRRHPEPGVQAAVTQDAVDQHLRLLAAHADRGHTARHLAQARERVGPRNRGADRLLLVESARGVHGGNLADRVAHHHVRHHAQVHPEVEQRDLEHGDTDHNGLHGPAAGVALGPLGGLTLLGLEEAVLVLELGVVVPLDHLEAAVHRVAERGEPRVEVTTHVLVLRALTAEHERLDRVEVRRGGHRGLADLDRLAARGHGKGQVRVATRTLRHRTSQKRRTGGVGELRPGLGERLGQRGNRTVGQCTDADQQRVGGLHRRQLGLLQEVGTTLQHRVAVGTAETERAQRHDKLAVLGELVERHLLRLGKHTDLEVIPADTRARVLKVQVRQHQTRVQRVAHLDKTHKTSCRLQVTDIGLGRPDAQVVVLCTPGREDLTHRIRLDRVTHRRTRTVALDVHRVGELAARLLVRVDRGRLLLRAVGQRNTLALTVGVDRTADHLGVDVATLALGVLRALQHHHRTALTTRVTVRRRVERVAETRGRQGTERAEGQRGVRCKDQVHGSHDSLVAVAVDDRLARKVQCRDTRRACRVQINRGTTQVKKVRQTVGLHREGRTGGTVRTHVVHVAAQVVHVGRARDIDTGLGTTVVNPRVLQGLEHHLHQHQLVRVKLLRLGGRNTELEAVDLAVRVDEATLVRHNHTGHTAQLGHGVRVPAVLRHTADGAAALLKELEVFILVASPRQANANTNDRRARGTRS